MESILRFKFYDAANMCKLLLLRLSHGEALKCLAFEKGSLAS
jgi:hypothetical protein